MRRALLLLGICGVVFGAALAARVAFVPDVVATAYAEEPQSVWQLETAFILESIENVALLGAVLVLLFIIGSIVRSAIRRQRGKPAA